MSITSLNEIFKFLVLSFSISILLSSCGDDENDIYNDIEGTWFGTRTYTGAGGATKYQYLTLQFNRNKTGDFQYESPSSFSVAQFKYSVSGSTIHCTGVSATSDGDINESFELYLQIQGDRLIPTNRFKEFILTRDGSVVTDADGNEISDGTNNGNSSGDNSIYEKKRFR